MLLHELNITIHKILDIYYYNLHMKFLSKWKINSRQWIPINYY